MGMTHVKMDVFKPSTTEKSEEVNFLVDSGAFYSFVDKNILKKLGVSIEDEREFILANGEFIKRDVGTLNFRYKGKVGGATVAFAENGDANLLGATALEALGLMLDPFKRILVTRDLPV